MPKKGVAKVNLSGFSPVDQGAERAGGLRYWVARLQRGMVGEEKIQSGCCPSGSDASAALTLLANPQSWWKSCSGFDPIYLSRIKVFCPITCVTLIQVLLVR